MNLAATLVRTLLPAAAPPAYRSVGVPRGGAREANSARGHDNPLRAESVRVL